VARAARRLWRLPEVRSRLALNAWADHLSTGSFSFSLRETPKVKLWVEADELEVDLYTAVPDKWCEGASRDALRQQLLARLPRGCRGGRWPGRSFRLREDGSAFDTFAVAMVDAMVDVFAPAAPMGP
jgi:hypothetical protein